MSVCVVSLADDKYLHLFACKNFIRMAVKIQEFSSILCSEFLVKTIKCVKRLVFLLGVGYYGRA